MASFLPQIGALEKDVVAWRRTLHANPELSFEEFETQAFVLARLAEMVRRWTVDTYTLMCAEQGVSGARKIAKTGVIARIGPAVGPAVALRADMDALPLQENTGLPFASKHGARAVYAPCHCAHGGQFDQRGAIMRARMMDTWRVCWQWPVCWRTQSCRFLTRVCNGDQHFDALRRQKAVVLLFQPAEEGGHGARLMVQEGCLDTVTHVFGVHLLTNVPLNTVALGAGPVFAHSDRFTVHVKGKVGVCDCPCWRRSLPLLQGWPRLDAA